MKIAIVGTSYLTDDEILPALTHIETIVERAKQNGDTIITGDAMGVDHLTRLISGRTEGVKLIVEVANKKEWNHPEGFKARNHRISQKADYVYSISTRIKKEACYHHSSSQKNHERTGGCYVLKHAVEKLGKKGEVIVI